MRTYTLEIKVDFDDEERFEIVKQHLFEQGRETLAMCMMLAGKRKPQVALHSQDFFAGNEEFDLTAEDVA
jgi:hypothetical protein